MGKHSKTHTAAVDAAAQAAEQLGKVTPPRGHVMQPTSGVERDLRATEVATHEAYGRTVK